MEIIGYIILIGFAVWVIYLYIKFQKLVKNASPNKVFDREYAKCESYIERRLYEALKANGEYVKSQIPCGKYSIDLALPVYRIAIECDGEAYHSSEKQKAHDRQKDAFLRKNGWKVLRFPGKRIHNDIPGIIKYIESVKARQ